MVFCSKTPTNIISNPEYGKTAKEQFNNSYPMVLSLDGLIIPHNYCHPIKNSADAELILDRVWLKTTNTPPPRF